MWAARSQSCGPTLAKPKPGSTTIWEASTPAEIARSIEADSSPETSAATSP
jgi:hypothetical protein